MERQNYTSIVIPVQEDAFVQPFRVRHLHRPGVTMPTHITLHAPFKYGEELDEEVLYKLAKLFSTYPPFKFSLSSTDRFADKGILYLVPEPAEPFHVLSQSIQARFPDTPPDYPDSVMHLTLGLSKTGEVGSIEEEFHREYGSRLPIEATATEVSIFEKHSDIWVLHTTFALSEPS